MKGKFIPAVLGFVIILIVMASCTPAGKMVYFNNIPEDKLRTILPAAAFTEPVIQNNDILNITVHTIDPQATAGINQPVLHPSIGSSTVQVTGTQQIAGYEVDNTGDIHLNYIGKVHLAGLTVNDARNKIEKEIGRYFKNPVVNVTFANFKISVVGEVNRPGTYVFPSQKVSFFDALGMAGDLNIYGRRDNVLLIRNIDSSAEKEYIRVNLNNTDFMRSPYYFLRQGDVIYVTPTNARVSVNNADRIQLLSVVSSITSSVALIVTIIINLGKK